MSDRWILSAMRAQQWERAKGEMRALAAILGSQPVQYEPATGKPIPNEKWERLRKMTEEFITTVEDDGLAE